jgi:hypothetical protein
MNKPIEINTQPPAKVPNKKRNGHSFFKNLDGFTVLKWIILTSISILMAPTDWAPMSLAVFQNLLRGEYYTASAMAILIIVIVIALQTFAKKITKDQLY